MNNPRSIFSSITIVMVLSILGFTSCTAGQVSTKRQIEALEEIRQALGLNESPLEFVEMTGMINSPGGDLEVALYQDDEGRIFYLNPATNQVVEIDARAVLSNISQDAPTLAADVLEAKALETLRTIIPDFEARRSAWEYEAGAKGGNYFFSWYDELAPGAMNRPFAQIGLHKSGVLFAYYNTLLLGR